MALNRFLRVVCTLLLALLATALPLRALAGVPQFDVVAGFDGFYRAGDWVPVVVTVSNLPTGPNDTPDTFRASLSISSTGLGDPPVTQVFSRLVEVPANAIQRFTIYAKFSDVSTGQFLEVRTINGKLITTVPLALTALDPENLLLLNISNDSTLYNIPLSRAVDVVTRANSPGERLPENWWGYESVSVALLGRWSDTLLRPAQETALENWIQAGGTLFLLAGSDPGSWQGGLIDRLLPGTVAGSERLDLSGPTPRLGGAAGTEVGPNEIIIARITPADDSQVLSSVEGFPLVVRRQVGLGSVVMLAPDFRAAPGATDRIVGDLWRALMPNRSLTDDRAALRHDLRSSLPLVTGSAAKAPNVVLILLLLVSYVICVGPLNFRFLAKRKKLELAWITVPLIVLVFSFLIYLIGALTKGGKLFYREVTLVQGVANHTQAATLGLKGVFSPEKRAYTIEPESAALSISENDKWERLPGRMRHSISMFQTTMLTQRGAGGSMLSFADPRTYLRYEDGKQSISSKPMGQWDLSWFDTLGVRDLGGAIEARITFTDSGLSGTLHNNTGRTLRGPMLYVGGGLYPLRDADLLPGDTVQLAPRGIVSPLLMNETGNRTPLLEPAALDAALRARWQLQVADSKVDAQERAHIANLAVKSATIAFAPILTSSYFPPRSGEVWLLAWGNEQSESPTTLNASPNVSSNSIVYAFRLPVEAKPGRTRIANRMLRRDIIWVPREGDASIGDNGILELRNTTVVFAISHPFSDPRIRVEEAQVFWVADIAESQDAILEVFDYSVSRWVPLQHKELSSITQQGVFQPLSGKMLLRLRSAERKGAGPNFSASMTTKLQQLMVEYVVVRD